MYVITFTFSSGFIGTLTHHNLNQIREWITIFGKPEAMRECNIIDIAVSKNDMPVSMSEAA